MDCVPSPPPLERHAAQFPRQFRLARVRMHIAHSVQEPRHLILSGFDDARIGMPGSGDAEGRSQIQVFFAIGIPDVNTLRALPNNWP